MIELKEAIKRGKEFVIEVFENQDEVILDSAKLEGEYWLVKYRIPLNIKPVNSLQNVLGINKRIFYKTLKVDENGEIVEIIDDDLHKNSASDIETQAA